MIVLELQKKLPVTGKNYQDRAFIDNLQAHEGFI